MKSSGEEQGFFSPRLPQPREHFQWQRDGSRVNGNHGNRKRGREAVVLSSGWLFLVGRRRGGASHSMFFVENACARGTRVCRCLRPDGTEAGIVTASCASVHTQAFPSRPAAPTLSPTVSAPGLFCMERAPMRTFIA